MTRPVIVPVVLALALALSVPAATAVYGGAEAAEGAYPFMVHLFIDEPHDDLVCGGTLIAPTFVLTAGHCVIGNRSLRDKLPTGGPTAEDMRAVLGRVDLEGCTIADCPGGEIIGVAAGHQHPEYNYVTFNHGLLAPQNDIAVLELETPSSFAPARPATPADLGLYPPGTMARVLGWGCTEQECFPTELMEVDVPVWDDVECNAAPNYVVMFHPATELCAGSDGKDSCGGDSGGPLFVYDEDGPVVVGVVNYGALFEVNLEDPMAGFVPCGSAQHPGVYAEVAAYESFLDPFLE